MTYLNSFTTAELKRSIKILKEARRLIRSGWTKNVFARNAQGNPTTVDSPDAVKFCLAGALRRASKYDDRSAESLRSCQGAVDLFRTVTGNPGSLTGWNDRISRKQEDVIAALTNAIEGGRSICSQRKAIENVSH